MLEYVHSQSIIHRDLKPENIVFQENGYMRLTDFGIARFYKHQNYKETSGTPGYMSPEVILRQNHGYESDFFALGVIIYELVVGRRPYTGTSRQEIRDQMVMKQARLQVEQIPKYFDLKILDLVNGLL